MATTQEEDLRELMADDDEANALLDAHLLAYLHAYQEYTVLTIELQSVLREGHIKLAHARRELSRTTSTSALSFGTSCVPSEFQALLRVGLAPRSDGQPDAPSVLELCESKGALVKEARKASGGGGLRNRRQGVATAAGPAAAGAVSAGGAPPDLNACPKDDRAPAHEGGEGSEGEEGSDDDDDADAPDFRAMLQELGVDRSQVDEIARSLEDGGPQGLMCGDTLALEGVNKDGSASTLEMRSHINFAPGGSMSGVKQAQFEALMRSDTEGAGVGGGAGVPGRKLPQRPDTSGDPLRWFSVLPPLPLRQAQKAFRRSAEISVQLANAVAAMQAARGHFLAQQAAMGLAVPVAGDNWSIAGF